MLLVPAVVLFKGTGHIILHKLGDSVPAALGDGLANTEVPLVGFRTVTVSLVDNKAVLTVLFVDKTSQALSQNAEGKLILGCLEPG